MARFTNDASRSRPVARDVLSDPFVVSRAFGARIANIVLTAQVQSAYDQAMAARARARRVASFIEAMWPDTPLRTLVVGAYQAQMCAAESAAQDVLAHAREHCGLAYARG